jgi:multiple sugar transport system substrate-binding protein
MAPLHGIAIEWDTHPLEGFEAHPIADLCAKYDLVVLDHPHIGEAVAGSCLQPLETVLPVEEIAAIGPRTVGRCFESYRYAGRHWAIPLDAATQVMAYRADLIGAPPLLWQDVAELARFGSVALSLSGPHAVLTFLSIAAAVGASPGAPELVTTEAGLASFELMRRIYQHGGGRFSAANPIQMLEQMSQTDEIALCPLIYGYVNYAMPQSRGGRLTFTDAPLTEPGGRRGSILGGTGIGISQRCRSSAQLVSHLSWLSSEHAQCSFIPKHEGQPSSRKSWSDGVLNSCSNGFYESTLATMEAATVRPRYKGYIHWQSWASARLREALETNEDARRVVDELRERHATLMGCQER